MKNYLSFVCKKIMTKRAVLLLIALCFLIGILCELGMILELDIQGAYKFSSYAFGFAQLFAIIFMLAHGKVYSNHVFRILMVVCALLVCIGAMLKIMHWNGANELLFVGSYAVVVMYGVFFLLKKQKITSDYLKVIWVTTFFGLWPLSIFHWLDIQWLLVSPTIF